MWNRHSLDEELLKARLDGGLHLLDTTHDLFDLGAGGPIQERDPGTRPGGVPGCGDSLGIAVRHEAEHERVDRVDVCPERACEADAIDCLDPVALHQQRTTRVERRLGQLNLADVVLGDDELGLAPPQDIGERAAIGHYALRARRERAVDRAIGGEHAGKMELCDRLDDSRAAHAGHSSALERRLVRPRVAPDHADSWLERPSVDADALDRAGSRTLAARDLCALERWAGWAGRSEQPVTVTKHDLGVRSDVDDQVHLVAEVRALGEDHAGRVGAHVARDAGQYVRTCAPVNGQPELASRKANRLVDRKSERRASERSGIDPE